MSGGSRGRFAELLIPVAAVTAVAGTLFGFTLARGQFGALEAALTALFVALFGWVTFWFWLTTLGALRVFRARHELIATRSIPSAATAMAPTAVVIPVHNEAVESVFARIEAMLDSAAEAGTGEALDFFVLSDTTDPDVWLREELAWARIRRSRKRGPELFYRRRGNKFRRKSGNIAEFCERWGSRYEFMIILDADSVMDGTTMVELVRRMEHAPALGILQAPSLPAMRTSLYARLQQFAASVYGPPIFAGLAYCFEGYGNFWGHNAIIRVDAFIEHCGLPGLAGRPPFGGPILSHDFVEAALMRRAGYEVRLAWDLVLGSHEQCPVSLSNAAARDRRWCQGNLQHLRLVFSPTFSWKSRMHFAIGVLFYVTATLWGLFVLLYAVVYFRAAGEPAAFVAPLRMASVGLFAVTLIFLFAAKGFALLLVLSDRARTAAHGGKVRLFVAAALEMLVSVLTAPILMVSHVGCLFSVVFGISVDWGTADRDETPSPWRDALHAHGLESLLGATLAVVAFFGAPALFLWLAPIWLGLLCAVPLGAALSSSGVGKYLFRHRLLVTPAETGACPILDRVGVLEAEFADPSDFTARFRKIVKDPWLNTLHLSTLETMGARVRHRPSLEALVGRVLSSGPGDLNMTEARAVLSDVWAVRTLHEESVVRGSASDRSSPTASVPLS
jgi:membrane glycosyltransferase